jgi:ubiquinone biosynthesis protein COQ9
MYVPEYGFSKSSLVNGAKSLGWTEAAHGICERGPIELVEYFVDTSTQQLKSIAAEHHDFAK